MSTRTGGRGILRSSIVGFACLLVLVSASVALGQGNVGIGTTTPDNSALLDLTSTSQGLLAPRLTTTQMNNIASPATGLLIYNTTAGTYYYYSGTTWLPFLTTATGWTLLGNAGTVAGTNFLGTTDAVDLVFKTDGLERMRLLSTGEIGIGTNLPSHKLELANGNFSLTNSNGTAGEVRFYEPSGLGTNYTSFVAGAQTADISYTLPANAPGTNYYLSSGSVTATDLQWVNPNATFWKVDGNSGTTPGTNFLGTTDAVDLRLRTNNTDRVAILSGGNVGIGTTSPGTKLEVKTGHLSLTNDNNTASELQFFEPSSSGSNKSTFKAGAQSSDITYRLPLSQGAANTFLTNDGSGNLSWSYNNVLQLGTETITQFTSDQHNLSISANKTLFRISSNGNGIDVTGIQAGEDGRLIIIVNVGSYNITLKDQDAGSSVGNRLVLGSGSNFSLAPNQNMTFVYDGVDGFWRSTASRP